MIDMAVGRDAWITPQGEVFFAGTIGTEGSRGVIPAEERIAPHDDAERVRFGADYVFTERRFSRALFGAIASDLAREWGIPEPEIADNGYGAFAVGDPYVPTAGEYLNTLVRRELEAA